MKLTDTERKLLADAIINLVVNDIKEEVGALSDDDLVAKAHATGAVGDIDADKMVLMPANPIHWGEWMASFGCTTTNNDDVCEGLPIVVVATTPWSPDSGESAESLQKRACATLDLHGLLRSLSHEQAKAFIRVKE